MRFTKMHGLGNDFIIFDAPAAGAPRAETIRRLADRYDEATLAALVAYLREHGPKLGIALDPSEQAG